MGGDIPPCLDGTGPGGGAPRLGQHQGRSRPIRPGPFASGGGGRLRLSAVCAGLLTRPAPFSLAKHRIGTKRHRVCLEIPQEVSQSELFPKEELGSGQYDLVACQAALAPVRPTHSSVRPVEDGLSGPGQWLRWCSRSPNRSVLRERRVPDEETGRRGPGGSTGRMEVPRWPGNRGNGPRAPLPSPGGVTMTQILPDRLGGHGRGSPRGVAVGTGPEEPVVIAGDLSTGSRRVRTGALRRWGGSLRSGLRLGTAGRPGLLGDA